MNKDFWKAALVRAVRTVAQSALAMIPAAATIQQVNWLTVLSTAALAGVVSILTSIATGLPEAQIKQQRPPDSEVRVVYVDQDGYEISPNDLTVEPDGTVRVLAYDDYADDGSPVVYSDEQCEDCNLSQYVDGGDDDGDA